MADIDVIKTLGKYMISLEPNIDYRNMQYEEFDQEVAAFEIQIEKSKETGKNEKQMGALAKGIPAFSKGVMDAVKAFDNNDPFTGSAAIVDAISSIITTATTISGASGPPGALIGSLLSVVSMILKLFSKQKPAKSLEKQLMDVLRVHDSEILIQQLKATQEGFIEIIEILSDTESQSISFSDLESLYAKHTGAVRLNQNIASKWILDSTNHEVELWGTVLLAHCFTYVRYTQSMAFAINVVEKKSQKLLLSELSVSNAHQLKFLIEIINVARNRGTLWVAHNGYLAYRDVVVSADKTSWKQVGSAPYTNMVSLCVTTRPSHGKSALDPSQQAYAQFAVEGLFDRYSKFRALPNNNHPFQRVNFEKNKIRARFGLLPLKSTKGHGTKLSIYQPGIQIPGASSSFPIIRERRNWPIDEQLGYYNGFATGLDVCAMPGFSDSTVLVYTANNDRLIVWEHGSKEHVKDEKKNLKFRLNFIYPDGYKLGMVKAVIPKVLPEEGDEDIFNNKNKDHRHSLVYGACEVPNNKSEINVAFVPSTEKLIWPQNDFPDNHPNDPNHMEIRAHFLNHYETINGPHAEMEAEESFLAPWKNFIGITTDSHYLWVYRAGAIACCTHTSVKQCLQDKLLMPEWMIYNIPEDISVVSYSPESLHKHYNRNKFEYCEKRGLLDLDACDDGTLIALFGEYIPSKRYIYTMTPKIDIKAKTLVIEETKQDALVHDIITNGWKSDRSQEADRIFKMPIPCWPLIEGLIKSLEKAVAK